MTSLKRAGLISVISVVMCGPGFAQQGTEAQREACTPDAFRLCTSAMPDSGRVEACLRSNGPRLSAACNAVFNPPQEPQTTGQIRDRDRDRGDRTRRDVQRRPQRDDQQSYDRPRDDRRDDGFSGFERRDNQPRQPQPQYDDD